MKGGTPELKLELYRTCLSFQLDNELENFDAVISYSSLEHSGLGRYGDALNPFGDIISVARAWCVNATLTMGLSSRADLGH